MLQHRNTHVLVLIRTHSAEPPCHAQQLQRHCSAHKTGSEFKAPHGWRSRECVCERENTHPLTPTDTQTQLLLQVVFENKTHTHTHTQNTHTQNKTHKTKSKQANIKTHRNVSDSAAVRARNPQRISHTGNESVQYPRYCANNKMAWILPYSLLVHACDCIVQLDCC